MVLTLGLRLLTPPKGLSFTVGADIGLTGTRNFVRELAPTAPYNVILGIAYAFDTRPAPAPSPPSEVEPVVVPAPTVPIRGHVREQGSDSPVAGATVAIVGHDASPQVTDSEGRFITYGLPEGDVVLDVSHPDFETARCAVPASSEASCSLVPVRREGQLRILTVDVNGNSVPKMGITVRGPSEQHVVSDLAGVATIEALEPGAYTAHIDDPVYLIALAELEILPRQETTVRLRVMRKPSRPAVVLKKRQIALRRQVSFATGSDEILPNSEPILLEVADVLLRNPDLELIEIQGHTDNRGDRSVNMRLSQERAEAVERWLVGHGVEPARLMAKGYGPTRPIAPNITQQNRARNRRVQFRIVRRVDLTAAAPK
jgi:outer membrane protein OmpA-like peptidoglycan-associated protein